MTVTWSFFIGSLCVVVSHGAALSKSTEELVLQAKTVNDPVAGATNTTMITLTTYQSMTISAPAYSYFSALIMDFGTPAISASILLDYGSPIFWVSSQALPAEAEGGASGTNGTQGGTVPPLYVADDSSSAVALNTTNMFTYAGGTVEGPMYSDEVAIRGRAPVMMNFTSATKVNYHSRPHINASMDEGILGLDAGSQSYETFFAALGISTPIAGYSVNPYVPKLSAAAAHNLAGMTAEAASYYKNPDAAGSLQLGGIDDSTINGGIACVPVTPPAQFPPPKTNILTNNLPFEGVQTNASFWWQFYTGSVTVDGDVMGDVNIPTFYDTGAPFMPTTSMGTALLDKFAPFAIDATVTGTTVDCTKYGPKDKLPTIEVAINEAFTVSIGPDEYFPELPGSSTPAQCYFNLNFQGGPGTLMIIGFQFWTKYVGIVDWNGMQAGMALRADYNGTDGTPLVQNCSITAQ